MRNAAWNGGTVTDVNYYGNSGIEFRLKNAKQNTAGFLESIIGIKSKPVVVEDLLYFLPGSNFPLNNGEYAVVRLDVSVELNSGQDAIIVDAIRIYAGKGRFSKLLREYNSCQHEVRKRKPA